MDFDFVYNLVTLFLVAALKFTLTGVLLIKTHTWTWLGRGLLVMFFFFAIVYSMGFLRLVGIEIPAWTNQVIRLIAVIDCVVILIALLTYEWPDGPDGIQWTKLLGLDR